MAAQFAELATTLFKAGSVGGVLDHLVDVATQIIDGADAASVTVQRDGTYSTPAYKLAAGRCCHWASFPIQALSFPGWGH